MQNNKFYNLQVLPYGFDTEMQLMETDTNGQ